MTRSSDAKYCRELRQIVRGDLRAPLFQSLVADARHARSQRRRISTDYTRVFRYLNKPAGMKL